MKFSPPQEYTPEEPERLHFELTKLTDEATDAFQAVEHERAARSKVRRIRGQASVFVYPCALDEFLVIDSTDASVKIQLPSLNAYSAGRSVAYARKSASNAVTFEGANGALVNGAAVFTTAAAVGRGIDIITDGTAWWAA